MYKIENLIKPIIIGAILTNSSLLLLYIIILYRPGFQYDNITLLHQMTVIIFIMFFVVMGSDLSLLTSSFDNEDNEDITAICNFILIINLGLLPASLLISLSILLYLKND